jgi:diguanylate cyclase (GGDEF)-like protein
MSVNRKALGHCLWRIWLFVGATATVLYFTVLRSIPHAIEVDYFLIGCGSFVAIVVGVRLHRPERVWVWYLFAAGMALWAVGDGVFNSLVIFRRSVPYPSPADPFFMAAYPLFGAGLILVRRSRVRSSRTGAIIEAAIITLSASLLSWVLIMQHYVEDPAASVMAKVVSTSYPVGDLFLLGAMIPMIGWIGKRPSTRFLMAWLALLLAADTIYSVMVIHGSYVAGAWVDAGWLIGYVLLGAAALHPSMAQRADEPAATAKPRSIGRLTLGLLAVASIAGPAVTVIEAARWDWRDAIAMAVGCGVIALLVLARLTGLVREADARQRELDVTLEQLSFQAGHDHLTGLANRALFSDRLEHATDRFARKASTFAVLLFDLDDFKAVNDGMGHAAGDRLLSEVAARLHAAARGSDTVARLGGDEFAILLEDIEDGAQAVRLAERILAALMVPLAVGGRELFPSASVGIALHESGADSADTLRRSDVAMYSAKRSGKGHFVLFDPEMGDAAAVRVELEADMRRVLDIDPDHLRLGIVAEGIERALPGSPRATSRSADAREIVSLQR